MIGILIFIIIVVFIGIIISILFSFKYLKKSNNKHIVENNQNKGHSSLLYELKTSLVSKAELQFYKKLEYLYGNSYKIQVQVNLASIINKNDTFRNDLFRNIDFGIFEKETLKPLLLIELNDSTHKNYKRYNRDIKIREILKQVQMPLITFYTDYDNNSDYIKKRIDCILSNSSKD